MSPCGFFCFFESPVHTCANSIAQVLQLGCLHNEIFLSLSWDILLFYSPPPGHVQLSVCPCPGGCPFWVFFNLVLPFPAMGLMPHKWVGWWRHHALFCHSCVTCFRATLSIFVLTFFLYTLNNGSSSRSSALVLLGHQGCNLLSLTSVSLLYVSLSCASIFSQMFLASLSSLLFMASILSLW